jgi:hypothetical protein
VLQYADDTLIILKANPDHTNNLHDVLLQFSNATSLKINFDKSTFVPIHVDPSVASALVSSLGCPVSSFPQTYLGLPLSTHKLGIAAFALIIAKIDKRLAGWIGKLLSMVGCVILIKAVLQALPTHLMSALLLPIGVLLEIDKRCRTFFWIGEKKVNGGQCKVAWEEVCSPLAKGGLGFKILRLQNLCLLMKHLAKVHSPGDSPWENWFSSSYAWSNLRCLREVSRFDSVMWKDIASSLPSFRSISKVFVGNRKGTSFWFDSWADDLALADRFQALFSHVTNPLASVFMVLSLGVPDFRLKSRPLHIPALELDSLLAIVGAIVLDDQSQDHRVCRV